MSLAALKRRLKMGVKLRLAHHDWATQGPNAKLKVGDVREVAIVQSNAVAFATPATDSGVSWLHWPKANEVRIDDKGFDIHLDGDKLFEKRMRYEFVE